MRADVCAKNLADRDFRSFWQNVNNYNNGNCTKYVSTVGGCSGKENITKMWCHHFEQLHNSVADDGFKRQFYDHIMPHKSNTAQYVITIHTLLECLHKQKFGKAVGLDGIAMEAIVHGGLTLVVHMCVLFNCFLQAQYLPRTFMDSVIIPLVKSKSGDLADVNNYRAIHVYV